MRRRLALYLTMLAVFGAAIWLVLAQGPRLAGTASAPPPASAGTGSVTGAGLIETLKAPLPKLLLQMVVIVAAARLLGALARRIRQPSVMGEMLAGILLGPSLLGTLLPDVNRFLFPASSLSALFLLSQIGVILFLFVVGVEVDVELLGRKADTAVLVSHASILVPFFLGSAASIFLYRSFAPTGVPFAAFALFLGVAMSITAFPVLARILEERNLTGTPLGTTAITAAAVDDVTAWCLLVLVVAVARAQDLLASVWTVLLTLLFVAVMLFVIRPVAARLIARRPLGRLGGAPVLAATVAFAFASALVTEAIGIHALFGAFLAGVCIPSTPELRSLLRERLEPFASILLMPLFFALTGLRTHVGLLNDLGSWLICLSIIAVATVGKLGGTLFAARATQMSWGDSFALGALMNTRGLVELIVLNVGYDLGILSPEIFTMLVLMALVTTFMTGPLLSLRDAWDRQAVAAAGKPASISESR